MTAAQRAVESIAKAQEHEPELSSDALKLFTTNGYMNACASLLELAKCQADRDACAAMNVQHKTLKLAGEFLRDILTLKETVDAKEMLATIIAELGRKANGASTSHGGDLDFPEVTDSGASKLG